MWEMIVWTSGMPVPIWLSDGVWVTGAAAAGDLRSQLSVKGRLKENVAFWKTEIKAPRTIVSIIESGYVLPLKSEPPALSGSNHASAHRHFAFTQESISELCASGCAVEVDAEPYICSPLSVVEGSSGKKRLVINLKHLNGSKSSSTV